jgi:DNA-binding NarL/FixJ family response regulator
MNGGAGMHPQIAQKALDLLRRPAAELEALTPKESPVKLTKRETEVLEQLSKGLSHTEIAENLYRSPKTIRNHMENIYRKLQVHSKLEAVLKAKNSFLI